MMRIILRTRLWSVMARQPVRMAHLPMCSASALYQIKLNSSQVINSNTCALRSHRYLSQEANASDEQGKLKDEIEDLMVKIDQLKQRLDQSKSRPDVKEVPIEITDRQIGDSEEEDNVYRLAYDFPGFKSKNIRVTVQDNILKIYAFQTSGKKSESKEKQTEYIYEHSNEEILPDEVRADQISASFDAENGFLVIEAILPEEVSSDQILTETRKRNEKLSKIRESLEKKQKLLQEMSKATSDSSKSS